MFSFCMNGLHADNMSRADTAGYQCTHTQTILEPTGYDEHKISVLIRRGRAVMC